MNAVISLLINIILLTIIVVGIVLFLGYLFFPRQTKNFVISVANKKNWVWVVLRYKTGFEDLLKVVPSKEIVTDIKGHAYILDTQYSVMKWNKRPVYLCIEGQQIPVHMKQEFEMLDIQKMSRQIESALTNDIARFLFSKKKDVMLTIMLILMCLDIVVLAFASYLIAKKI